jgi:site-specific DNA-methyltransferase (adenine-specific)
MVPDGLGTALKPAFEPIVLARKPLSEGTVAANVLRWGTGALNIDGCRVPTTESLNGGAYAKDATQRSEMWGEEAGNSWKRGGAGEYVQPTGRWPANVVHDGSDEVVGAFPQSSPGGKTATRGGSRESAYGFGAGGSIAKADSGVGSASRFFYSAKASKADRAGSKHPTVKPVALMQWLATLITPPGGTILDPFAGSGTTGAAARNKGFKVILCEREDEYVADIRARFESVRPVRSDPLSALLRWNAAVASYRSKQVAA